jgi:hypothetical protein
MTTGLEGYEAHLDVLRIHTEFLINGFLEDYELKKLKEYRDQSPENALFQAMYHKFDGNQEVAISILMDESIFPADRLPTDGEYTTHYRWERDPGPDWQPCNEERPCTGKPHTGVDFLFAAHIVLN